MATALTPPTQKTATPDSAAALRAEPCRSAPTSGTSTHGASAMGISSAEVVPMAVSMRGASA